MDIDIGDDRDSLSHEKQPLTSTPRSQSQSPYSSYQQQQQQQWRPSTPNTPKLGSPLSLGSPLTLRPNEQGQGYPNTPPTRRTTGEFSRQWKSPPTRGYTPSSPNPNPNTLAMASQRTSSETIRPPSRRSSMSSIRSIPTSISRNSMDLGSGSATTLPGKYIGPEMNKVLHRKRLSESGILIGNGNGKSSLGLGLAGGEGGRKGFSWRFWMWGDAIGSTSMLRWVPEVLWILGSLGCLIAIAIVLKSFDGNPQPEWPGPFNLNTAVAFLTILTHTAYLVPVVEGLGQLCWLRYSTGSGSSHGYGIPRPLRDFGVIDAATRGGVNGSFRLLFGYRQGGLLGVLGALIILTSIFTTPLTQGMVVYTADLIPGDGGITAVQTHNGTSSATIHAYTNQTTVHVQWGYLLPLFVQIVLSAVFLASIVIWTRLEGMQILKTSSLATMVALSDDSDGLDGMAEIQGTGGNGAIIGSIANIREVERKASTLMVRLEKDPLSGLALGLVPAYDVGDAGGGGGGGGGGGFMSRKEDLESKLTGGTNILRTRMSSAKDRRRKLNRNTRIVGGVIQ